MNASVAAIIPTWDRQFCASIQKYGEISARSGPDLVP